MAKSKIQFVCQSCGWSSSRWLGKCPECGQWNSFVEESVREDRYAGMTESTDVLAKPILLNQIDVLDTPRIPSGISELDRVLGGGLIAGSVVLIGGDPGIGKSSLLLQACQSYGGRETPVLYVSGEESAQQIKLRAQRLRVDARQLYFFPEVNLDVILEKIQSLKPCVVVIDSIQTIYKIDIPSAPGSVSQIRESSTQLMFLAKRLQIAMVLIGHVTKDGVIAGPRVLEHLVDAVLYFEGEAQHTFRILRTIKNRFGSTNEIGIFEMKTDGLLPVENPSEVFLSQSDPHAAGTVVVCTIEGSRPLLVEIQALVCRTTYGVAQRTTSGFDTRRLNLLLAVLEKRKGLPLNQLDVFVNIAGGLKIEEPAIDLAVVMAILSSFNDHPIPPKTVVLGEVGLGGEIRSVPQIEKRVGECEKLGFQQVFYPRGNSKDLSQIHTIKMIEVGNLQETSKILDHKVLKTQH